MERQSYLKKAMQQSAARTMGTDKARPRMWTTQKVAENDISEYMSRPTEHLDPIQDLDPDSPTYGLLYHLADFDAADDPNHPVR